ncbi:hypothetical protein ACMD2_08626, partial [Ananas comosus]
SQNPSPHKSVPSSPRRLSQIRAFLASSSPPPPSKKSRPRRPLVLLLPPSILKARTRRSPAAEEEEGERERSISTPTHREESIPFLVAQEIETEAQFQKDFISKLVCLVLRS